MRFPSAGPETRSGAYDKPRGYGGFEAGYQTWLWAPGRHGIFSRTARPILPLIPDADARNLPNRERQSRRCRHLRR
jgi:hypothetical protein